MEMLKTFSNIQNDFVNITCDSKTSRAKVLSLSCLHACCSMVMKYFSSCSFKDNFYFLILGEVGNW